ncbi:MAG: hypothetical protein K2J92_04485, partial [Muribaculaceae bacterium]|nr:hypothetical protein [Muribaculaceae bacterium]
SMAFVIESTGSSGENMITFSPKSTAAKDMGAAASSEDMNNNGLVNILKFRNLVKESGLSLSGQPGLKLTCF